MRGKLLAAAAAVGFAIEATAQTATEPATGPAAAAESAAPSSASPAAQAAKQEFDAALAKWNEVARQIAEIRKNRRDARPEEASKLSEDLAPLRKEAEAALEAVSDAGVAAYQAAPDAFPEINSTLLYVAQYHLTGDSRGDGGDQYERAAKLLNKLLAAGAGEKWPALRMMAGVAAVCTNDFDQAQECFDKARQAGVLGGAPPSSNPADPRTRVFELATQYDADLPALRSAWEQEAAIRAKEAEADDLPRVKLITAKGDIVIELFEDQAPQAVANFLTLVKKGFYDGVGFHRVLPGFMAQGGDPQGTGAGGPGYSIACECYRPDYRHHFRGSLSMAHAGRDTGGSQFFLTFVPTTFLDGRHTVFGRVVAGMDVAAAIKRRDPEGPAGPMESIVRAEVLRDRGHAYEFNKLPGR